MKKIKVLVTSICFAAPIMFGGTVNAAPVEDTYTSQCSSLEMSTVSNSEKIRIELLLGDTTPYYNLCVATADNYINIREKADDSSEVIGKLYTGNAAVIEELQGEWIKVKSGTVEGYIASEYVAIGNEIKEYLSDYAFQYATTNTMTLRLRDKAEDNAATLALLPEGGMYLVKGENEDWVKIEADGQVGYVSKEFVNITYEFDNAVSIQEELENLQAEEEARQQEEAQKVAAKKQTTTGSTKQSSSSSSKSSSSANKSSSSRTESETTVSSSSGSIGASLVSYAKQFVGNPYVWGGTSLTNGADCSGFTQAVFRNFGYSIPRTSRQQAKTGTAVSASNLQKGDLICYASNGTVNHVAIYIGNGKVVHASNAKDGIKISNYNYRTPYTIRRVL